MTTWALVVPQAIAYAQIAQLPPQAGLFAAFAGLVVLRLDAPLLFIDAKLLRDRVREQLAAEAPVRIVLLDLQFTPDLDVESLDVLNALRGELLQRGVALWLANVRAQVRDLLRRSGLTEAVGEARVYRTLADAVPDARAALRS
jgi:SulP family sulfate permease